jgi:hypothetical protein
VRIRRRLNRRFIPRSLPVGRPWGHGPIGAIVALFKEAPLLLICHSGPGPARPRGAARDSGSTVTSWPSGAPGPRAPADSGPESDGHGDRPPAAPRPEQAAGHWQGPPAAVVRVPLDSDSESDDDLESLRLAVVWSLVRQAST